MNKYIKIQNALYGKYTEPETSLINIIKPIGFSILCCLVYLERENYTTTWVGQIMDIMDLDKRTVNKYLAILQKNKIIDCDIDLVKCKKKDTFTINLESYMSIEGGFELIPVSIFLKHYKTIKDYGWLILCFLTKNHNVLFGAVSNEGFAAMSEVVIGTHLGLNKNTVHTYVHLLAKNKIIKMTQGKNIMTGYDEVGKESYSYFPNEYVVPFKVRIKVKVEE